jgi:hypothetical protein
VSGVSRTARTVGDMFETFQTLRSSLPPLLIETPGASAPCDVSLCLDPFFRQRPRVLPVHLWEVRSR